MFLEPTKAPMLGRDCTILYTSEEVWRPGRKVPVSRGNQLFKKPSQ
jgi:hypothetical protein